MRVREAIVREFVQQWLTQAENDFGAAQLMLSEGKYLSLVGFHSQQAAEKFLKAFLVEHQIEFPKTHEIRDLLSLVAQVDRRLAESLRSASALSPYGVDIRYPGDLPELSLEQAKTAVELAALVREQVHRALRGD